MRILAIVVLYKQRAQNSSTLRTLLAARKTANNKITIILWDNTPGGQDPGDLPPNALYIQRPDNPGLASAYNYALSYASKHQYIWLLTLDQDSVLPEDYFTHITQAARQLQGNPNLAAIVPQVTGDGRLLSPFHLVFSAFPRWYAPGYTGLPQTAVLAVNSASLLNVEAAQEAGGYDPNFPLDASDLCLFQRLHQAGKHVYIAGNIRVHHDFSILDPARRMSLDRYRAMLLDECAFWDLYMGSLARFERMLRLALRFVRDFTQGKNAGFRKITLAELRRRLTHSRSQRISDWKQWTATRSLQPQLIVNKESVVTHS